MKQHSSPKKSSRRSFTKSIASSLAAAPFVAAYGLSPQPDAEATEPTIPSNTTPTILSPMIFKDHIPPFTISDGSLEIEAHGLVRGPDTSGHRKYKYTGNIPGRYSLGRVKLIAIYESAHLGTNVVEQWDRDLSGQDAAVKISLEYETSSGSGRYNPVSTDPQILIVSANGGGNTSLIFEIDKKLDDERPAHTTSEYQRKNIGIPAVMEMTERRYFALAKWNWLAPPD
jgi:hypothetical protein